MSRARPFSIYLLKEGFDATNSLREDHDLEAADATDLPEGAALYILDAHPKPPWWRSYFGVTEPLLQQFKGALVFLPVDHRCFALSFGQVFHHLNDAAYEYEFGLRVTLNSVDPNKLKSADMVAPGVARRKRTQVPVSTELTGLIYLTERRFPIGLREPGKGLHSFAEMAIVRVEIKRSTLALSVRTQERSRVNIHAAGKSWG